MSEESEFIMEIVKAGSVRQLFGIVSDRLTSYLPYADRESIIKSLCEREQLGSTGIGNGVAMPHAQLEKLSQPVALFLRSKKPVGFDAPDGKPVDLFYVLLVPQGSSAHYLRLLSRVARVLRADGVRSKLRKAPYSELKGILREVGLEEIGPVLMPGSKEANGGNRR